MPYVLLALPVVLCFGLVAVQLSARWLFRKPVSPVPYDCLEDFGIHLAAEIDAADLADKAARGLLRLRQIDGYLATYFEVPLAPDPRYSWREMLHDARRDPDLRWLILGLGLPTQLLPTKAPDGFSTSLCHHRLLNCRQHSTYFTALVLEQLVEGLTNAALNSASRASLKTLAHETAHELVEASRVHAGTGTTVYGFAEQTGIHNRTLDRLLHDFYASYQDVDDAFVVLGVLAAYQDHCDRAGLPQPEGLRERIRDLLARPPLEPLEACFNPVHEHAFPREQRQLPRDLRAWGSYITDGANDVDVGVNVDVLCSLMQNFERWGLAQRRAMLDQITAVLDYIAFLARTGLLFKPEFHPFYSPPAFAYLWRRYMKAYQAAPSTEQRLFDPGERSAEIDARLREHWERTFFVTPSTARPACNAFDLLLLGHAFPERLPSIRAALRVPRQNGTPVTTEFFGVVYPLLWLFGSPALTFGLLLTWPTKSAIPASDS